MVKHEDFRISFMHTGLGLRVLSRNNIISETGFLGFRALVKNLPCNHEDLITHSQNPCKFLAQRRAYNFRAGCVVRPGRSQGLASTIVTATVPGLVKDPKKAEKKPRKALWPPHAWAHPHHMCTHTHIK